MTSREERKEIMDYIRARRDQYSEPGMSLARVALGIVLDWLERRDEREDRKRK